MSRPLLVAYATKHESTHEVAEAIATRLRDEGWVVEVRRAGEVGDLDRYGAVVLGSAIYTGRIHRDARGFLGVHAEALAQLPFAVFAIGPRTSDPADLAGSRQQLDRGLRHAPQPLMTTVFGGVIDPTRLHFPYSRMEASDARDWNAIDAWAGEVAQAFSSVGALSR